MAQIGSSEAEEKPTYAKLRPNQNLETITFEEALELFKLPRTLGEFEEQEVVAAIGRFGPYIRHDGKFVSIPREFDPHGTPSTAPQIHARCVGGCAGARSVGVGVALGVHPGRYEARLGAAIGQHKLPGGAERDFCRDAPRQLEAQGLRVGEAQPRRASAVCQLLIGDPAFRYLHSQGVALRPLYAEAVHIQRRPLNQAAAGR